MSQLSAKEFVVWLASRADIFFLVYRFADVFNKAYDPLERTYAILDTFLPEIEEGPLENDQSVVERNTGYTRTPAHIRMNGENCGNGSTALSPPHSVFQREGSHLGQPCSSTSSPLSSPGLTGPNFTLSPNSVTLDSNWQANKHSVLQRNAAMFNNDLIADVKFLVGSQGHTQVIPAHKYVLATGSSVFFAMFHGGLKEISEEIAVPDVDPAAFLILLKYLYCDEIHLETETILGTLYAAKKYIVPHLARACVNYLETSLTAKNACMLLSQSRLFEEPELMQRCWEVIDAQAEMALKAECFVEIDIHTLETILARETLNCKEMHLFNAALCWAGAECGRRDLDPTPSNKRRALGEALFLLRIPTMSLEEYANGAAQIGILTLQETIDIFLNFTAQNKPQLSYPTKPRTGLKSQVCHRFQSCAYRSNQWRYRGRCDSIQFAVDKRIFVVGFGLYGSSNGAADYSIKIELKRHGQVLADFKTKFFSDGSSNTFHVYFENPIQVGPASLALTLCTPGNLASLVSGSATSSFADRL